MLRLRRDEPEAGHGARARDDGVVVGVDEADAEAREAEGFGEGGDDVDEVAIEGGVGGEEGRDAGEGRGGEGGAGVDLVADDVEAAGGGEAEEGYESGFGDRRAERIGWVCYEDAFDRCVLGLGVFVGGLEGGESELEIGGAVAVDWDQADFCSPAEISIVSEDLTKVSDDALLNV